jgi:hypothetical protein
MIFGRFLGMLNHLILQQLYDLSGPQLEAQVADRISFRVFLGTTEINPDYAAVWMFRERLKIIEIFHNNFRNSPLPKNRTIA